MRLLIALLFASAFITPAAPHDRWANGEVVPAWVKRYCCGPEDVRHLRAQQVKAAPDGWHIEGYPTPIPYGTEQVSQDGDYWVFYRVYANGDVSPIFCFFVPPQGS